MKTSSSNKPPASRALDAIYAQQWAITPEMLETIVSVAERSNERPESIEALLASRAEPLRETTQTMVKNGVAIVPVRGPIFRYANLFTAISGATALGTVAQDFGEAVSNNAVKAIVLEIDSPGGMVAGVSEFAEQVRAATAIKPVIAYVSDTGASAAYWIASAASELIIRDTARVGSVGAVMQVVRDRGDGETMKFVSSQSPRKHANPDSDIGQQDYQAQVDAIAGVFVESVARYRGVTVATVLKDFGQGAVRVGAAAVHAGMADRLGSLESTIARLATAHTKGRIAMNEDQGRMVTLALVREQYPEIAAALRAEGAEAELARIQSVQAQSMPGHEQLVATMMFDGKTTGPEAAVQVLAAERNTLAQQHSGLQADAAVLKGVAPHAALSQPLSDTTGALEARCEAEFKRDPTIRRDFKTVDAYIAHERAIAKGNLRLVGRIGDPT